MATNFQDASGEIRLVGTIYAPGATVGDVFTVQADGSLAPAPGGGSQAGAARVLGPYPFTHATPNLNAGVSFYTPTIGDILLDFWVETDTAWNGTSPLCDIGSATMFANGQGMISQLGNAPCDLGNADISDFYNALNGSGSPQGGVNAMLAAASGGFTPNRRLPAKFTSTAPLQVVVSQDGLTSGDPTGSTLGASGIYLVVATPVAP